MKSRILNIFGALALFLVAAPFAIASFIHDSDLLTASPRNEWGQWHDVVNVLTNAFFSWRIDPATLFLANLWPFAITADQALLTVYASLILLGLLILMARNILNFSSFSCIAGAISVLAVTVGFGLDITIIASAGAFIWTALAVSLLLGGERLQYVGAILLTGLACYLISYLPQLSLFILIFGSLSAMSYSDTRHSSFSSLLLIGLAILFFYCGWLAHIPSIPAYPPLSHVIPDDGVPGNITPLVGPAPVIPLIDHLAVKYLYSKAALIIALTSILILFILKKRAINRPNSGTLIVVLAVLIALDTSLPEYIALTLPLSALPRIIPGLFLHAVSPIALAFISLALTLLTAKYFRTGSVIYSVFLAVIMLGMTIRHQAKTNEALAPFREVSAAHKSGAINDGEHKELLRILASPSYPVIRANGLFILRDRNLLGSLKEIKLPIEGTLLFSSHLHNDKGLKRITDGRSNTRWSAERGNQQGDEFIEIFLSSPVYIRGMNPDPGSFVADFPRGLRIKGASSCTAENGKILAEYRTLFDTPSFQGAVRFTPDGYPYYGAQADVRAYFAESLPLQCFRIEQTGAEKSFDWSIAELELLTAD